MLFLFCAALGLPSQAAEETCLKYEPTTIELTGTIKPVTFPGPPNYQSVREGDKPERYWVLYLLKPICVDGDPNNNINEAEKNIKSLQLIRPEIFGIRNKDLLRTKCSRRRGTPSVKAKKE